MTLGDPAPALGSVDSKWFVTALQKSRNVVMITDASDRLVWANEGFTGLTGYALDEVRGAQPADFLQGPDTDPDAARQIQAAVGDGRTFEGEILNYRKDGSGYWAWLSVTPIYDD